MSVKLSGDLARNNQQLQYGLRGAIILSSLLFTMVYGISQWGGVLLSKGINKCVSVKTRGKGFTLKVYFQEKVNYVVKMSQNILNFIN